MSPTLHAPWLPSPVRLLATFAILLLASGCAPVEDTGLTVAVRDSAGITIVENSGQLDPSGGGWSVAPQPDLSIGTFEGDSLQQLYEVQGSLMLADGSIAIANGGSGEIRIYGPSGEFVRGLGRKGEGPGEFQRPALAGLLGSDTLVVVDNQLRRISWLHVEEGFLESVTMAEEVGGGVYPRGMFPDGTVIVGGGFYFSSASGDQLSDGYTRRATTYRSAARDGTMVTDFGEFPGSEFFMRVMNQGGGAFAMSASLIPFGKYAMAAVGSQRLYFGSGDSWEIQAYSPTGELAEIIRLDREARAVGGGDLDAYIESRVENASDQVEAQAIRQQYSEMPIPDQMPAFASLETDPLGFLWIERYRTPGEEPPVYDILNPEGRLVGWVSLPDDLDILEIGQDFILGLYRDELEVEYVRMYRLHRPGV